MGEWNVWCLFSNLDYKKVGNVEVELMCFLFNYDEYYVV